MSTSKDIINVPAVEDEIAEESLHSNTSKLKLTNAVEHYKNLLAKNNLILPECSSSISQEAMLMGEDIYQYTMDMLATKFISEEELIHIEEECEEESFKAAEECEEESSEEVEEVETDSSSDEYEPVEKKKKVDYIPLDYKIKVVNIAKAHPKWDLRTLQKKGCSRLKKKEYLSKWEEEIKKGGNTFDKYAIIDTWTYDRFIEARQNNSPVTTKNLQQWALAAAGQFENFKFKASDRWVKKFKSKHKIRRQKVTKFVSQKEVATVDDILNSATIFRTQALNLIPKYNKDYVINTDQIECQYQSNFNRTRDQQGHKTVFVKHQDMNEVTHSYTAQYSMTLSGKLLPQVFVCLQESSDKFGSTAQINEYVQKYKNVVITSSKSGKLSPGLYIEFLQSCLKSYVGNEQFLLLIDSWGGQTKPEIYDEIFQDDNKLPTCTIKVIPPKCTPLVQPCDVYFFRQVKNLIERLQNSAYLIEQNREINSCEDCIKIQSIVHHQLSSPIFNKMIRYAWYASKLSEDREIFMNVNEVCFPTNLLQQRCSCKQLAFINCARCRKVFCFQCFYDNYHAGSCM